MKVIVVFRHVVEGHVGFYGFGMNEMANVILEKFGLNNANPTNSAAQDLGEQSQPGHCGRKHDNLSNLGWQSAASGDNHNQVIYKQSG
jgi:hypothetical protein